MNKKNILLFSLLFSSILGYAYDAVGHRIIADIAYTNLTCKARKATDKTLGKMGIIYESTWADEVRSDSKYKYSYQWHYQNLKDNLETADLKKLMDQPTSEGEHLFFAIETMKSRIKANHNDAEALKFLVHFMGDLHQPMHLGRAEDLGGNKVTMQWFGKNTNIHSIWDGQITESSKMSYTEFSNYLQNKFSKRKKEFKNLSPLQSLEVAYKIRNEIYSYDNTNTNNYHYIYRFNDDLELMLYQGGIQLAKVLNEIYK